MTRTLVRRRVRRGGVAVVALALAAALGLAAPALAHTQVAPAAPEPGSTVTEGPVTVAITTTDPVLEAGQRSIVLRGPDGSEQYFGDGCATVTNSTTVSAQITPGQPGTYTVIWTLVALDGHVQSSEDFAPFTFTWQPADGQQTATGQSAVPTCGEAAATQKPTQEKADEKAPVLNEHGWGDLGWIIGGVAIVFVAAVIVIMLLVRRSLTNEDDED
ncbi:CopC domain-containing protein [Paramicrobacterium humi]|uniref:CopC domain-containing protein n=1 Tax=Paramicrobacterium humi TaxID=640635 RepID=A0A1H4ML17_9MICO|nr:copper resistance protein CopC [Microbacterium humi]SEB83052.1 CopC domain-containing protein [Microbacterium humi]